MRDNSDLKQNKRQKRESKIVNCQLRMIPAVPLKTSTHCTQQKERSVQNTAKIMIYELPPNQKSSIQEYHKLLKKKR